MNLECTIATYYGVVASCESSNFCGSALERIQPRVVSYEEQATAIREQLAKLLEDKEEWTKAAQTLAGIDLDSGKLTENFESPSAFIH